MTDDRHLNHVVARSHTLLAAHAPVVCSDLDEYHHLEQLARLHLRHQPGAAPETRQFLRPPDHVVFHHDLLDLPFHLRAELVKRGRLSTAWRAPHDELAPGRPRCAAARMQVVSLQLHSVLEEIAG